MVPFAGLLAALQQIPDPRRRQGQRYSLAQLLLFAVLAILAGATSYRGMRAFIAVHREHLNATFGAHFRRAPAVNTLRGLFQALDPAELEAAFRWHAQSLDAAASPAGSRRVIALDGKTLKRSFGHARSTWTLALLAEVAQAEGLSASVLSIETIRQALLRLEAGWKRAKRWLTSPDPAYAQKN